MAPCGPMTAIVSLASTPVSVSVPGRPDGGELAEGQVRERDRVDRQVEQRTAGECGVGQAPRAVGVQPLAVVGLDRLDLAEHAVLEASAYDVDVREEARPHRFDGEQAPCPGRSR